MHNFPKNSVDKRLNSRRTVISTVQHSPVQCSVHVLGSTVHWCSVLVQYSAVKCSNVHAIHCSAVQDSKIEFSTVYCTVVNCMDE